MQILQGCDLNFDTKSRNCQNFKHQCCLRCVDEYMLIIYIFFKKGTTEQSFIYWPVDRPAKYPPHPVCQTLTTEFQHEVVGTCSDKVWFIAVVLENFSSSL